MSNDKENKADPAQAESVEEAVAGAPVAAADAPAGAPAAVVVRVAAQASDGSEDDEEEEEEAPAARPVRRMAGVCDERVWRAFVPAVFARAVDIARRVVGDDDGDVVAFVRAAIEGMSFSSESARFSALGMQLGVAGATPQCIDLLGALVRVTAKRAAVSPEYARLFASAAALEAHVLERGARVCGRTFEEVWMVVAAASARAEVWAPVARRKKGDEPDAEAVAALGRMLDPPADDVPAVRAGRRKRKREDE